MDLKDQVVSLELAKKLKELGVKQESIYFWAASVPDKMTLTMDYYPQKWDQSVVERYAAFSVAELGEMLPEVYPSYREKGEWQSRHPDLLMGGFKANKEVDARAMMLIYLIQSGVVKTNHGNH